MRKWSNPPSGPGANGKTCTTASTLIGPYTCGNGSESPEVLSYTTLDINNAGSIRSSASPCRPANNALATRTTWCPPEQWRSEERRVGKGCRYWWWACYGNEETREDE